MIGLSRRRRRAVDRRQQGDVVARSHPAVGPAVAHEGPALGLRHQLDGAVVLGERVVQLQLALVDLDVVGVDVVAGRDRLRGEADDLPVATDGVALGDGADRDLVAGRDHLADGDLAIPGLEAGPRQERHLGDDDVVPFVELDRDVGEGDGPALGTAEERGGRGGWCGHRAILHEDG
jgi:hypothetical protein